MKCCDLTLPSPEENLAADEVLLEVCESGNLEGVLRFWEPTNTFVVVGYANHVALEVNQAFCKANGIPILRRCSGGGTVLQGPGCLNYSLILPTAAAPALASISGTNDYILQIHQRILRSILQAPVEKQGHTDLAIGGLKFSGNAQRRRKAFLLFHGSFLLHADIELIEQALPLPSRQPDYRVNRSHTEFLMNLRVPAELLKSALIKAWGANEALVGIPRDEICTAAQKYRQDEWNFKF
jgi:lipoate-protein ligase A